MRNAQKFLVNALIMTVTSLILRAVNVSFTVYISGKIGAEGMGIFQLILSIYLFATTLAISGVGLATTRLVAEELADNSHQGVRQAVKKCLVYSLFTGCLACLLLCLNAAYIAEHWLHGKISPDPLYALAISLPFLALSAVLCGYFTAVRRVIKTSSAQIFEQFITITATVYGVNLLAPQGLDYACLALVLGGTLAEFLTFIYLYVLYRLDICRYNNGVAVGAPIRSRLLRIALPVGLSACLRSGLSAYKQILIPWGFEKSGIPCPVALTQYGLIRGMVMPLLCFPSALLAAFSSLLIPEIAEKVVQNNSRRINQIISRIFKITLLFSIGVGGLLSAYADQLSLAIYKNLDTATYLRVFSPLVVIIYLDDIVDGILKGLNQQVPVVAINILDSAFSICLLYLLLPLFGIKGYIFVFFCSELFNGFLSLHRLIRITHVKLNFFNWILLPGGTMTFVIFWIKGLFPTQLWLGMTLATGAYLLILYQLGCLTKADFRL